jgi:hypothetical protein
MPLCPQITNTPITVSLTADFTVTDVIPVLPATTEQLDGVVVLLDGKTKAYYQTTAPVTGLNEGDIWFDTDDGNKQYFYTGTAWVSVQDTAIAAAQSAATAAAAAATAAQSTADGKNKVFRQTSAPTASAAGDLWFDTDDDNRIYRWSGSAWVANDLGTNALANFSANKITSGSINASVVTVSNINAGNISTGTLSADRIASASITGTKIAAGTITASNITSGTITASQIATGTITATQIAAGTITTTQLATGTLSANNITTGTLSATVGLSAVTGTIGGFNIGTNYLSTTAGTSSGFWFSTNGDSSFRTVNATGFQMGSSGALTMGGGTISGASTIEATGSITTSGSGFITSAGEMTSTGEFRAVFGRNNSVANAVNVWISSTGQIRHTTASSARYKENITDLRDVAELDPKKLLDIPVRAFSYKNNYLSSDDDRAGILIPGLIAEEVDAIYPLAADYADGQVENINDRAILVNLLALVQDLYKEIATLKGE